MRIAGIQETYLPKLQVEFEELPTSFQDKIRQGGWGDFILMPPLYWDLELME